MTGRFHRVARWLELGLTCVALAVAGAPVSAPASGEAVEAVSAGGRGAPEPRGDAKGARVFARVARSPIGPQAAETRVRLAPRPPGRRPGGPPLRLYLTHRALLR